MKPTGPSSMGDLARQFLAGAQALTLDHERGHHTGNGHAANTASDPSGMYALAQKFRHGADSLTIFCDRERPFEKK